MISIWKNIQNVILENTEDDRQYEIKQDLMIDCHNMSKNWQTVQYLFLIYQVC